MKIIKLKYVFLLLAISVLSTGCIGVNQEFKNIRTQILNDLEDDFDRQFEFSVGPVGFFIASQFVKFTDTEENVDEILAKVNNIHIGIYDRLSSFAKPSLSLLKSISSSLVNEDWKPIVKTIDGNEMVGIFVKAENSDDIEELFVVTLTDEELVLVKLQGSLGSIIEIVIREHGQNLKIEDHS